jgi:TPR repeat protein
MRSNQTNTNTNESRISDTMNKYKNRDDVYTQNNIVDRKNYSEQDNLIEVFNLGKEIFEYRDYERAKYWFKKAAEQGDNDAQKILKNINPENQKSNNQSQSNIISRNRIIWMDRKYNNETELKIKT